jgi:hypothetical protein
MIAKILKAFAAVATQGTTTTNEENSPPIVDFIVLKVLLNSVPLSAFFSINFKGLKA